MVDYWPEGEEKGQAAEGEKSVNVVEFGGGTCARWDLCAVEVEGRGVKEPAGEPGELGWEVVRRKKGVRRLGQVGGRERLGDGLKRVEEGRGCGRMETDDDDVASGSTRAGTDDEGDGTDDDDVEMGSTRAGTGDEDDRWEKKEARIGELRSGPRMEARSARRTRSSRKAEDASVGVAGEMQAGDRRGGGCGSGGCAGRSCGGKNRWRTTDDRGEVFGVGRRVLGRQGEGEEDRDEPDECMMVELGPRFIGAVDREEPTIGMTFQVAAVKKALASVWRICRAGNIVQFGDDPGDCFVKNKVTGRRIKMEKKGVVCHSGGICEEERAEGRRRVGELGQRDGDH